MMNVPAAEVRNTVAIVGWIKIYRSKIQSICNNKVLVTSVSILYKILGPLFFTTFAF